MRTRSVTSIVMFCGASVVLWQLLSCLGFMQGRWPSIGAVLAAFFDPEFVFRALVALWNTGWTVFGALAVGLPLGAVAGVGVGLSGRYLDGAYLLMNSFRSVPVTVLLPVFFALFGLDYFLIPLLATPIIAVMGANMTQAVRESTLTRAKLLRQFEFGRFAYVRHVLPWDVADSLFATLRTVIPMSLAIEVAVDYFLRSNNGLGDLISESYYSTNQEPNMFAAIFLAAVLGSVFVVVVDIGSTRMLKWKHGT